MAVGWCRSLVLVGGLAVLLVLAAGCRESAIAPRPASADRVQGAAAEAAEGAADRRVQLDAQGRPAREPLWQAPTSGAPLELSYLLPGAQAVLAWRVADFLLQPEAGKLLDSLGPWGELARVDLPRRAGVPLTSIATLVCGFYGVEQGPPDCVLVLRLSEPLDPAKLAQSLPGAAVEANELRAFRAGGFGYWLPAGQSDRLLVVSPADWLSDIVAAAGGAPPLRRELELLRAASDSQRQFTFLFAPNFLATGGKGMLADEAGPLRAEIDWLLGSFPRGAMLSANVNELLFVELAVYASADQKPLVQERDLRRRWQELPSRANDYLAGVALSDYNRAVLERWPSMLDVLVDYTRSDVEERIVRLRAYLPAIAAHNLALAGWLALEAASATTSSAPSAPAEPGNLAARLARPIALAFPRTPLDKALELFATEVGVELEIAGEDLQREGITKNQMLALDVQDQPAGKVLESILRLANSDGKLVYVVDSRADDTGQRRDVLVVTTKVAAASRGKSK
ncbi:MAG: hypothetical protein K2Y37_22120 [Pirellulales bacterium]|nr:hypothetical protein [Pirellulales bacterium]